MNSFTCTIRSSIPTMHSFTSTMHSFTPTMYSPACTVPSMVAPVSCWIMDTPVPDTVKHPVLPLSLPPTNVAYKSLLDEPIPNEMSLLDSLIPSKVIVPSATWIVATTFPEGAQIILYDDPCGVCPADTVLELDTTDEERDSASSIFSNVSPVASSAVSSAVSSPILAATSDALSIASSPTLAAASASLSVASTPESVSSPAPWPAVSSSAAVSSPVLSSEESPHSPLLPPLPIASPLRRKREQPDSLPLPPPDPKRQQPSSRFRCDFPGCGYVTTRRWNLDQQHRATHDDIVQQRFPCPLCDKTYTRNNDLLRHKRAKHSGQL